MSIRSARVMAVVWLVTALATIGVHLVHGATEHWRRRVSAAEPTAEKSVPFMEHGRTRYVPPAVATWNDRVAVARLVLVVTLIPLTLATLIVAYRTDAIGRRWRSG